MRKRLSFSTALFLTVALLGAPSALAAEPAGWDCTANATRANSISLATGSTGIPMMPSVPPEGPKVITDWKVKVGAGLGPIPQRLEVFEVRSELSDYEKIGESPIETLVDGTNSFSARIPVDEGDSIGLYGQNGTLVCDKEAGAVSLLYEGTVATGETKQFKGEIGVGTPVVITVEDDRDGDGYGDESQDGCPESALLQSSCPLVALEIGDVEVKRRAILIEVGNNTEASVEAAGEVRWLVRPQPKGGAKQSWKGKQVKVGLAASAAKTVVPGTTVVLRVPLPKPVLGHLDRLLPRQALQARIDVRGTNFVPSVGTHELKVTLPGRAKPQQPR